MLTHAYASVLSSLLYSFVNRDMFMRYRGGGVGHKATWHLNDTLGQGVMTEMDLPEEIIEDVNEENTVTNAKQR